MAPGPVLVSVTVADEPQQWKDAGFAVEDSSCHAGEVRIELGGAGRGITSWALRDVQAGPLDGLDTQVSQEPLGSGSVHPNGTVSLDHLVITSGHPMRTRAALEDRGFAVRRSVDMGDRRYTFFRVGEAILELVG